MAGLGPMRPLRLERSKDDDATHFFDLLQEQEAGATGLAMALHDIGLLRSREHGSSEARWLGCTAKDARLGGDVA
ncbi:hypothetical protein C1T17_13025 [Sphingobium sp. SCG-1]|nr:hypothetical protein C1T17_13025 [Sphingobium sp. SCG-1]